MYTNDDVVGVELGGALKNVIALAAGVVAGHGFGHNTLCALITRGLAEITRLGVAMGARPPTFFGLAGMGDLVLTCTGHVSRNRTVGFELGRGRTLDDILGGMTAVAEGREDGGGRARAGRQVSGGDADLRPGLRYPDGENGPRRGGEQPHDAGSEAGTLVVTASPIQGPGRSH